MKKKLRGLKRADIQLDFDLYRVNVPMPDVSDNYLSVVDLHPAGIEKTIWFQHGYAGVLESFEFQMNYFARHYRVIAPDLRGHGQSDAPYTAYTMAELVADMHQIVERLDLPQRFTLAAHSFGGSLAVEYAAAHPERLEKLVLIATAGEFKLPRIVRIVAKWLPASLVRPLWPFRPKWDAEFHVLKRMMVNNMLAWKGWDVFKQIETPTLVITGERDRYFPRWVFDDVAGNIPNAETHDVGSAKHKVQLERHQAVNRVIERFVGDDSRRSWRDRDSGGMQEQNKPWLKHYSKEIPISVPVPRHPLHTFLESAADWFPKRNATIFYGHKLTYRQLNERVNQLAHALHGFGIAPGDRVMVALPNMPQMIIAYYAILKIGGVAVLPATDADPEQLREQLKQTKPKVLITLTAFSKLAAFAKKIAGIEQLIFVDLRSIVPVQTYQKVIARWAADGDDEETLTVAKQIGVRFSTLIQDAPLENPHVKVASSDLAVILFTSGTTGHSKGVCLSHFNLVANTLQTRHWIPEMKMGEEVWLSVAPLAHSYGMTAAMNIPIALAGAIVLLPVFDIQEILEHIRDYQPSFFPAAPAIYTAINQAPHVRDYKLSSIKACISGGSPLPIEVQEAFEKLTRGRLVEGYGLTEASPVTHANPLFGQRKPGSIGVPIPNTEAKIIDMGTGEEMPAGGVGELLARGPQVMMGYWQADGTIDAEGEIVDGWLRTGDVASMDRDGFFTIISRKKDLIQVGDSVIYPRDIEEVIYEHNKVMEVAVAGVKTADDETKIKAFIAPRPGSEISQKEILTLCQRRLPPNSVPASIEFRESLPKSFIGKVLRRKLVD